MSQSQTALPTLHVPADIARALGKSEWWVKEQARRGRIPFTKPGRAYRFTDEQFAEIMRLYEQRPFGTPRQQGNPAAPTSKAPERRQLPVKSPPVQLRARTPRRVANALKTQPQAA